MAVPSSSLPLGLVLAGCLLSPAAWCQSISPSPRSASSSPRPWPAPVRAVSHPQLHWETAVAGSPGDPILVQGPVTEGLPTNLLRQQPHQVLQSPGRVPQAAGNHPTKHPHFYQPHYWSKYHRPIQPSPAVLPAADAAERWKSPYSYGYFGASGHRQWKQHHGYRDRYTEWRLQ